MSEKLNNMFIELVNQNIGIAHKVSRIYFDDKDEREDVVQEMMYQLWRSYPCFDNKSKFSTWMYKVCLNTALTWQRKYKKKKDEMPLPTHYDIADESPESKDEAISLLIDAIAALSPLNKAIMLLYLENMSYEEIASITGVSRSNVSVRLVRIKKDLETQLKQKIKSINDVNT